MNPWKVILITAILSTVVSFFVAGLIHLMCLLIQRFSKQAPALATPVSVPQEASQPDAEIAVAIAAVKAYLSRRS
jgi:Na+-transporting methylmalonyl-CoA/oxaloacetate decarboxylase gamma subunit